MNEGRIVQIGSPRAIYDRPHTRFVADFIGTSNFIDGTVLGFEDQHQLWRVRTPLGDLLVSAEAVLQAGAHVTVSVRPEDVELTEDEAPANRLLNTCSGIVDQKVFLGDFVDFQVKVGETMLLSRAHPSLRTPIGDKINVRMEPLKCVALPDDATAATRAMSAA
jgi:iron(III) transport system ATP-binding protein